MAFYTDVKLMIDGSVVATSPRADVGLPGDHKLTVRDVTWKSPDKHAFLRYLKKSCTVQAKGPLDKPVSLDLAIASMKGDAIVYLD